MAKCHYCGELTRMYYYDTPICLTCSDLPIEERLRRREAAQKKQSSPKARAKAKKAPSKPKRKSAGS
jgi:hypothetical protein